MSAPLIVKNIVPVIINVIFTQLRVKWNRKCPNWKAFLSRLQLLKNTAAGNLLWKKPWYRCILLMFLSAVWKISPKPYREHKNLTQPSVTWMKKLMSISKPGVSVWFTGTIPMFTWMAFISNVAWAASSGMFPSLLPFASAGCRREILSAAEGVKEDCESWRFSLHGWNSSGLLVYVWS